MKESVLKSIANSLDTNLSKKQLRVLAMQMPTSFYYANRKIKGSALKRELESSPDCKKDERGNVLDANGKPIIEGDMYQTIDLFPLNHLRRMRRAYNKNGVQGIRDYIKWFIPHHKQLMQQFPELIRTKGANNKIEQPKVTTDGTK